MDARSGIIAARQVAECGHGDDGHEELHRQQGPAALRRAGGKRHAMTCRGVRAPELKSLHVFIDRAHVCLENDVLRRCGPDHCREPLERGRGPGGPAGVADIMPQQKGVEPKVRRLAIADGIFPSPAEVADGFILHRGDRHRGEVPRACQPSQLHGVPAVRVDAVPGLFGHQRGRHHPAVVVCCREISIAPVPTGAGCRDKDQVRGLGLPLANQLIEVPLACTNRPERGHLGAMVLSHIGHRDGRFVDIHSNAECARLEHGCPPRVQVMVRHQAVLVSGKRTRVTSGVNLPPAEVIMSRRMRLATDEAGNKNRHVILAARSVRGFN